MKKNPVLSRELAPLVVACSNIFMQSHTNTHNKMAAEIADLNQKLSFYSQSFDSMGATQRAWEPVAQHAPPVLSTFGPARPAASLRLLSQHAPPLLSTFNPARSARSSAPSFKNAPCSSPSSA